MLCIILFSGLDDRGLLLRNHLDVSLPSSGVVVLALFNTAIDRKERRRRGPDSNIANAVVLKVHFLPPHCWVIAARLQLEKRAPATAVA